MTATEDHNYETGLKRKRGPSPHVETQEEAGDDPYLSRFSDDEELHCGMCLSIYGSPYTVIPCLHTFDKYCLVSWWKNNDTCPVCKTRPTSARHSFYVIGDRYNVKPPAHKRARVPEQVEDGRDTEIYPLEVASPAPVNHNKEDEDADEEEILRQAEDKLDELDEFDELDELEDEYEYEYKEEEEDDYDDSMVGGRLVFPCPACRPGHPSGYTCTIPIPEPTDAVKAWETHEYMSDRWSVIEPGRGQSRVPLALGLHNRPFATRIFTGEVKAEINRACAKHVECATCSAYMPLDRPRRLESTCQLCSKATCALFDPLGCPVRVYRALLLLPFHEAGKTINIIALWEIISRANRHFMTNIVESTRFTNRLAANNLTPATIVQELIKSAGCGPEHYLCTTCIRNVLEGEFARWWQTKKESGAVPVAAEVARLNDCWYGRECQTQNSNARHAARFNHDCDSRSTEPQAPVPPAPPALVYD